MRSWLVPALALILMSLSCFAQGRKLPDITFKAHSTEFANANRTYNEDDQYTDTLHDERIMETLLGILLENPELVIELRGHTAWNEDPALGLQRAELVTAYLQANGIDPGRLNPKNFAHVAPLISDEVIAALPSREEQEAANQKNRRVEINVVRLQE